MATTTKLVSGSDLALYIGDVMIGCAQEVSISMEAEVQSATCKASGGWAESSIGTLSWTASASGVTKYYSSADDATNEGVDDFKAYFKNRTLLTIKYSTDSVGDKYEEGTAYITSVEESAGESEATYSISFQGTGPLVTKTVAA